MLNRAYNDMLEALKPNSADYRNFSGPADFAADYRARFEKVAEVIAGLAPPLAPENDSGAPKP